MNTIRALAMAGVMIGTASCAPKTVREAPPPVRVVPLPPPVQTAPPPRPAIGWEDTALSPGAWAYREDGPSASYGELFTMRCESSGRRIVLHRQGATGALIFRTSFGARTLPGGPGGVVLPASDPLLDQIAFSRGRIAVEAEGQARLVLPTWPEPARVVDECRG